MTKVIELYKECGEFCTERGHPKLDWLRAEVESALKKSESLTFERRGVKILTPSFIDELLSELAIQFGIDAINKCISFVPPLEPVLQNQIARGIRMRKIRD